jgi:tripartite-type tricarboxylate transporter receptor subunit TctC
MKRIVQQSATSPLMLARASPTMRQIIWRKRMLNHWKGLAAGLCFGASIAAAPATAADGFYQGKRLTVLINFAVGGPTDIEGRLFAKHIGKHLAGTPNIIVQNMDGGGGATGTNFLGEIAPKDGTVLGYLTGVAWRYVNIKERSRVDFLSYNMLAYQPGTTVYYARSNVEPGLKVASDILKAQNLVVGGLTADSSKDILERLSLDLLGVKYKYVTGYTSNSNARLALQRNEINMFAESPPGYIAAVAPSLVASGEVVPLYFDPGYNGKRFSRPAQANGLDMKPFQEFLRDVKGREPEGKLWDIYKKAIAINGAMQRIVAFPPGTPKPAMDTMREAIRKLATDQEFASDAMKSVGFVPDYEAGDSVQAEVTAALSLPEEDRKFIADYIARGQNQ